MRDFNRPNKFNDRSGNNRFGGRDQKRNFDAPAMFKAKCDECGSSCEVPFRPSGERPVLCNDCFRGGREDRGFGRARNEKPIFSREDRDFSKPRTEAPKNTGVSLEQFKDLEKKVDRMLEILEVILELADADEEEDFDDEEEMPDFDFTEEEVEVIEKPKAKKAPTKKEVAEKPASKKAPTKKSTPKK